jgi:hypothetical protein
MCLKVLEQNHHRDIIIKEGEVDDLFEWISNNYNNEYLGLPFTSIYTSFTKSFWKYGWICYGKKKRRKWIRLFKVFKFNNL